MHCFSFLRLGVTVWELAWADSTLAVSGNWLSYGSGHLSRSDCILNKKYILNLTISLVVFHNLLQGVWIKPIMFYETFTYTVN